MSAFDGPSALDVIEAFQPDVAILDIGLPAMDGYELAARIRDRLGANAPVCVAITGYGQDHDRGRSLREGFRAHLVKPLAIDDLGAVLATVDRERAALS